MIKLVIRQREKGSRLAAISGTISTIFSEFEGASAVEYIGAG
ncbi:hypothetical protein BCU66_006915 [Vibrio sp. 10N.286.49.B1]|nr:MULTISPECIES: hypothetical protein [unclassified Vibrio]